VLANREKLGFWLVASLLIVAAAGKSILYDNLDPDFFWHLRVADQLSRDGIGRIVDEISFESIREPWTPYSWLAELGMSALWQLTGLPGVLVTTIFLVAIFFFLIALASREACVVAADEPRDVATLVSLLVAMLLSLAYLSFRPVLLALVLIALIVFLVLRDRRVSGSSWTWLVVPAVAILANVHLYVIVAVALLWAYAIGSAVDARSAGRSGRRDANDDLQYPPNLKTSTLPVTRYLLIASASTLAACCTPMLPGAVAQALAYRTSDVMVASGAIAEMTPFYHGTIGKIVALMIACVWLVAIVRRRRLGISLLFMLLVATIFLFQFGRFSPLFAIVFAPVLACVLPSMSSRSLGRKPVVWIAAALVLVGVLRVGSSIPAHLELDAWLTRNGPDAPHYPAAAAKFVEKNLATPKPLERQRLLNEFTWGGYLAWRLGDRYQVFVDGRTQLYTPDFWRGMLGDRERLTSRIKASGASVAIVSVRTQRLFPALRQLGWQEVYRDEFAVVLVPRVDPGP